MVSFCWSPQALSFWIYFGWIWDLTRAVEVIQGHSGLQIRNEAYCENPIWKFVVVLQHSNQLHNGFAERVPPRSHWYAFLESFFILGRCRRALKSSRLTTRPFLWGVKMGWNGQNFQDKISWHIAFTKANAIKMHQILCRGVLTYLMCTMAWDYIFGWSSEVKWGQKGHVTWQNISISTKDFADTVVFVSKQAYFRMIASKMQRLKREFSWSHICVVYENAWWQSGKCWQFVLQLAFWSSPDFFFTIGQKWSKLPVGGNLDTLFGP